MGSTESPLPSKQDEITVFVTGFGVCFPSILTIEMEYHALSLQHAQLPYCSWMTSSKHAIANTNSHSLSGSKVL